MSIERRLSSRNVSMQNQCWFSTCDKDRISTRNVQFILSTRKLGKSFCPGVDWWNGKAAFRQTLSRIKPQTEHLQLRPVGSNFIYIIKPKIFLEVSSAGNPVSFDYSKFVPVRRPVESYRCFVHCLIKADGQCVRPVPLIFINTEYIFCANELGWGLAIRQFLPFNVLRGWGVKSFKEMSRISFCVTDLGTFFDDGNSSDYDSITCTCETSITFNYVPAAISKLTIFHLRCILN